MAYYVRKIARAKWRLLDDNSEDIIENYRADTIANDMKTTANKLSLWRAEDLSIESLEPLIVINSLLGDTFGRIQLLIIPDKLLGNYTLVQEDGDTIVINYRKCHYNVVNLSVKKHIQFAKDVVLTILRYEDDRTEGTNKPELILQFTKEEQLQLVKKWIDLNEISFDNLKDQQKIEYEKKFL